MIGTYARAISDIRRAAAICSASAALRRYSSIARSYSADLNRLVFTVGGSLPYSCISSPYPDGMPP